MWKDYKIVNNLEVNCPRSEAIYCGHLSQWFKQIQQILVLQFFKNISSMIFIFLILFFLHHANSKLYYAYFILRHGARYHTNSFFDGAQTMPLWGQNTPTGYRQMQRLGQLIRKEYIYDRKLLSQQYKSEELNVYCLDTNRSCTSIQSFMYGLYPQGTGPHMRKSFEKYSIPPYSNKTGMKQNIYALPKGFQPIKINKFPATFYQCSKQASYRDKLIKKNQKNFNRITKQHQPFLKNISQMFQIPDNNITSYTVKKCFDTAMIDKYLGRPLPANFTESDFQLLKLFSNLYYHHITSDQEYFLVNTLSFSDIFNKFDRLIRDPDSIHRATFFGSQQTYLLPLSRAINISSIKCVEELLATNKTSATQCEIDLLLYSSSLIFQLYSKDQINFFVKVRSNGRYVKLCSQQREECDYEEFRKQVEKSMDMENIDFYCGGHIGNLLNFTKKYEDKKRNFSPLQYL